MRRLRYLVSNCKDSTENVTGLIGEIHDEVGIMLYIR